MAVVGDSRFVYFSLADENGNPVTGRAKANFTITFTRGNVACTDVLTVSEIGGGRYFASYTADAPGTDYLGLYDPGTDTLIEDVEQIEGGATKLVTLNQDYGHAGALAFTAVPDPQDYTVYAFLSADWQTGNQRTAYAKGQSGLNPNGTWQTTIIVAPGVYNIVALNGTNTYLIAVYLTVQS